MHGINNLGTVQLNFDVFIYSVKNHQHGYLLCNTFYFTFYLTLLCMFNVTRAPWKSSIAIQKGLPCIKKTEINE